MNRKNTRRIAVGMAFVMLITGCTNNGTLPVSNTVEQRNTDVSVADSVSDV